MAVRNQNATVTLVDAPSRNRILAALPSVEFNRIEADLEPCELSINLVLYEANSPISHVYFPTSGCVSMVNVMSDGAVEVGTIGFEGWAGLPLLLGDDRMPSRAFVQLSGTSYRMEADAFQKSLARNPTYARLLNRHSLALFNQAAQSVACNRLHTLESRCARWLLMTHDRMRMEPFMLTHEFLSYMLGVHRPAVTLAAGVLQRAGLIRYTRGKVTVLDRSRLEAASCACYDITKRNYDRLVGG
ncbi:MAG TPA: Crp/Fnr family transcriptional regulator [Gemmatimonadaceae bacterium]|nr:Crp/Fnr family transcriptional regulator [Gemmatimonadaceae bacterium]